MSDFAATKVHAQIRLSQSAREWVVAFALSLVLVLIVTLPYFLGYELARPGTQFMGTLMNPEDSNSYLAKMQQGYEGAWLYSIPYTSLAHSREFLGGFYLLLGHLARTLGFSLMTMWHLARFGFGLVLCLATFAFVRAFVPDPRTRWLAFLLALTGSGLGWVLFLAGQNYWLGNFPVDFKMPESHLFFTLLTFPHFMVGTILLLAVIWLELRVLSGGGWGPAVAGGLVNLALAVVYPFLIYLAAAVVILNWAALVVDRVREAKGPGQMQGKALRLWREAAQAGLAFLLPLPLLIYYARVLQTNSVFAAWDAQSITPSPHPLHYLFAFFPLIALAVPTLREVRYRGLWLWVLAVALLIYAPLNPQRRFVEGIHIPLSILAAAGLAGYFLPRLRSTRAFEWLSQRPG